MEAENAVGSQNDPLLQTKLFVPAPQEDLVRCQKLIDMPQVGLFIGCDFGRNLTLVSAPAGYGKTTLVSQ